MSGVLQAFLGGPSAVQVLLASGTPVDSQEVQVARSLGAEVLEEVAKEGVPVARLRLAFHQFLPTDPKRALERLERVLEGLPEDPLKRSLDIVGGSRTVGAEALITVDEARGWISKAVRVLIHAPHFSSALVHLRNSDAYTQPSIIEAERAIQELREYAEKYASAFGSHHVKPLLRLADENEDIAQIIDVLSVKNPAVFDSDYTREWATGEITALIKTLEGDRHPAKNVKEALRRYEASRVPNDNGHEDKTVEGALAALGLRWYVQHYDYYFNARAIQALEVYARVNEDAKAVLALL